MDMLFYLHRASLPITQTRVATEGNQNPIHCLGVWFYF